MATTLVNTQRRRQLIELSHQAFYRPRWGYRVASIRVSEHNPRTGKVGFREVKKKFPGTLTLLGGASIGGLPDEIAQVPAIRALHRAGKIRLVVDTPEMVSEREAAAARTAAKASADEAKATREVAAARAAVDKAEAKAAKPSRPRRSRGASDTSGE